jgi:hypothetical protein
VVEKSEADAAADPNAFVISNVAYPGCNVPNLIMHGYALTGDEVAHHRRGTTRVHGTPSLMVYYPLV